jgi:hypothetical protein
MQVDTASLRPLTFASHTYTKPNGTSFHLLMPVFGELRPYGRHGWLPTCLSCLQIKHTLSRQSSKQLSAMSAAQLLAYLARAVCTSWKGELVGAEGQELAWAGAQDLDSYPMPPADIPLLPVIRAAMQGHLP